MKIKERNREPEKKIEHLEIFKFRFMKENFLAEWNKKYWKD